ncbi:hypothetical protein [Roseimicrobium gellanilyticum]|uniref:hypothetical protein n=1 Tax=Roseimicrobium gellanilyticum TaxID=748857 RepID=UPI0011BF009B|nr:hypothetical protein [Roseimicrobium gellanilyticum]
MKLLLLAIPFLAVSCASMDTGYPSSVAMERDEKRIFDEPSRASDDPSSPLSDVMLQRGRVGLTAATF